MVASGAVAVVCVINDGSVTYGVEAKGEFVLRLCRLQVRNFNAEEESTAECKLTGTAVTLRSHSISPPSAIKPPS